MTRDGRKWKTTAKKWNFSCKEKKWRSNDSCLECFNEERDIDDVLGAQSWSDCSDKTQWMYRIKSQATWSSGCFCLELCCIGFNVADFWVSVTVHLVCNSVDPHLGINPNEPRMAYFWVNMHRNTLFFAALLGTVLWFFGFLILLPRGFKKGGKWGDDNSILLIIGGVNWTK